MSHQLGMSHQLSESSVKNSPGFEYLLEKAGRASFAVQGKIKKMGNIVPELMVRLDLL